MSLRGGGTEGEMAVWSHPRRTVWGPGKAKWRPSSGQRLGTAAGRGLGYSLRKENWLAGLRA